MNGCSGENHSGSSIESFNVQQAYLVCRPEPLPTCGGTIKDEFSVGERAGCCSVDVGRNRVGRSSADSEVHELVDVARTAR